MKNIIFNYKDIFRTLSYRNYRLYFSGQSISLIGTWIQILALGWLTYKMTNSAFLLGFVGFAGRIPTLIFAPFAGVIVDRMNKYKLLILTQVLAMLQAAILTILLFTGIIEIWHIIVLGAFLGIVNSFDMPVRQSLVVEMIDRKDDLGNAIALNSAMVNIARLIGPGVAGILISLVGENWCFLINALSFIPIIWTLLLMRIPMGKKVSGKTNNLNEFKEGISYVFGFSPIRFILGLLALVSLMGMPYQVLMPIFAKDIFSGGPDTLGLLMTSIGIGALMGALYLAARKTVLGLGKLIPAGTLIFGTALIIFPFTSEFWVALIVLLFAGFGMMTEMTSSNTILQTIVDDNKRGRVMSYYSIAFMGTVPLGNLLSGWLADTIGVQNTVMAGGVICILGAVYFALKLPMMRTLVKPIYVKKDIIPTAEQ